MTMRSILTILFSVFLMQIASAQWKKMVFPPVPIQCGETVRYGSTWGKNNDFSSANFADCLPEGNTKTYNGEDVTYRFEVNVESDVRVTTKCHVCQRCLSDDGQRRWCFEVYCFG